MKKNIILLTSLCIVMVLARIIKTSQFNFLFMLWNLFLAFVPYWVSGYISNLGKTSLMKFWLVFSAWLLFLPNAPYMLTDLFHLHKRSELPIWYDLVLILSFAVTGMFLFYLSVNKMSLQAKERFPHIYHPFFLIVLFFLVSYGVYIGRFLRLNSWDVIHPLRLAKSCLSTFTNVPQFKDMVCFTILFSLFLSFIHSIINSGLKQSSNA